MIEVYDIGGKVSKALDRGEGFTHAMIYRESLGLASGEIVSIKALGLDGEPMATLPARLSAAWKLPWGIYKECDWLHQMDLSLPYPKSTEYYLQWWGNLPIEQEIIVFLFTPVLIPTTTLPTAAASTV